MLAFFLFYFLLLYLQNVPVSMDVQEIVLNPNILYSYTVCMEFNTRIMVSFSLEFHLSDYVMYETSCIHCTKNDIKVLH